MKLLDFVCLYEQPHDIYCTVHYGITHYFSLQLYLIGSRFGPLSTISCS